MGEGQPEPIDTVYPQGIHCCALTKKTQPVWIEVLLVEAAGIALISHPSKKLWHFRYLRYHQESLSSQ